MIGFAFPMIGPTSFSFVLKSFSETGRVIQWAQR